MEQVTTVPLRALRESPFNPRKHYDPAGLQQLADSIATQGLLQPIVARPLAQADVEAQFEIVFGHRRFRAAGLAGVEQVQVILREYTDEQAALAQLHENAKRADVNAMEEADAIARLESEFKLTPAQIQKAVGISLSSVYNARKLARCHPDVRYAVLNEKLPPQVAVEVARWPVGAQKAALGKLKQRADLVTGDWPSYREAKQLLGHMLVPLSNAPFVLSDSKLRPEAGACDKCPKLTGNDPAWEGVDPKQCTDRACYQDKVAFVRAAKIAELRDAGETVLEGDEAKAKWPLSWENPSGYVDVDETAFEENGENISFRQALARAPKKFKRPEQLHIVNPHADVHDLCSFMRNEDAAALLKVLKKTPADMVAPSGEGDLFGGGQQQAGSGRGADPFDAWTQAERAMGHRDSVAAIAKAVAAAVCTHQRSTEELRDVLRREFQLGGEYGSIVEAQFGIDTAKAKAKEEADAAEMEFEEHLFIDEWLSQQSADTLGALVVAINVMEQFNHGNMGIGSRSQAARAVAIAERYGIDVLQVQP